MAHAGLLGWGREAERRGRGIGGRGGGGWGEVVVCVCGGGGGGAKKEDLEVARADCGYRLILDQNARQDGF